MHPFLLESQTLEENVQHVQCMFNLKTCFFFTLSADFVNSLNRFCQFKKKNSEKMTIVLDCKEEVYSV